MEKSKQYFDRILVLISKQFNEIVQQKNKKYSGYSLDITSELNYIKPSAYNPNKIYIIVRFSNASLYYNQVSLPISFNILAEQNSFNACRELIFDYVTEFNLAKDETGDIIQRYESPIVLSNFNEIGSGYRSLLSCSGGFLISSDNNTIESINYVWKDSENNEKIEKILPLFVSFNVTNDLDSQPFYQTGNFASSIAKVAVFTLSFSTYQFVDSHLFNTILSIIDIDSNVENDYDKNYNYNDTVFHFIIVFKNGKIIEKDMRLSQMSSSQPLDGLPTSDFTFTC